MSKAWSIVAVLLFASVASAAEMRSIDIDYSDGHYTLESSVWFDAQIDALYAVFSRWDYGKQFSSAIVEARDVEPDASGRPGFYVVNRGCILFFCKSLERRGYVEREPSVRLRAYADPERSDFEVCNESWDFVEDGGGTVVTYTLYMRPDFWVPPGIGPYMIKRKLRNDGARALDRIEALAQQYGRTGGIVASD